MLPRIQPHCQTVQSLETSSAKAETAQLVYFTEERGGPLWNAEPARP